MTEQYYEPTKEEIKESRKKAGLTQKAAAELILYAERSWIKWERGEHPMHPSAWFLWLTKTRQLKDFPHGGLTR